MHSCLQLIEYHFNGKDTSQIDYVLESTSMINEYVNFEREALNTSTHDPILVRFSESINGHQKYIRL
jgi:predicted extracellular nuclease